jgi:hypothetical protein
MYARIRKLPIKRLLSFSADGQQLADFFRRRFRGSFIDISTLILAPLSPSYALKKNETSAVKPLCAQTGVCAAPSAGVVRGA